MKETAILPTYSIPIDLGDDTSSSASRSGQPKEETFAEDPSSQATPTSISPQDRGKGAWLFLLAASLVFMSSWGFCISFGVFRAFYFRHPPFAGVQTISEIPVISIGLIQAISPFLLRYLSGRNEKRKHLMWAGMIILTASTIGAAFVKTPVQLIMTQGVLNGIGSGLLFAPSISLIDEWFFYRRSLAYGIYFGAVSLAGAILPPIFSSLLTKHGSKVVLIGWAIISGLTISTSILFIRSRLQVSTISKKPDISYKFFTSPLFWLVSVATVLQALAQYLPAVYLPSYAVDIGSTAENASLLLTYNNIASMVCQPAIGALADTRGVALPLLLGTVISSLSVLVVWGFSHTYALVAIVAVLFGGFGSAFTVLRNRFATAIVGDFDHGNQELIVSGALMLIRGAATLGSGFLGAKVVEEAEGIGLRGGYGAGKWRPLILTVGILMASASVGALGFVGKRKLNGVK